ncbi:MAG: response regulator [Thermoproteota archaeon]|jgi:DNA-binding response OmpR family regulator|nr:response regulator [Thermoproteota archaeon]
MLQSTREKSKNKRIGVGTVQTKKTSSHLRHYKILIVDDETDITLALKTGLEQNGFSVDAYNDPMIALSKFKPAFYDLLLLDIKMPHLNGFQLYQEVKKKDNNARACFITAYEVFYENLKEDYPTLDVGCFIKKPVEMDNLVKKIMKELKC